MTADELRQLLEQGESETVEFKSSLPDANTLAREVSALANTGRESTLVIGVNERDPKRGGLAHPGVVGDHIRMWAEEYIVPPPRVEYEVVALEPGRNFTVVHVAPSDRAHVTNEGAFVRRGARVVPLSAGELESRVRETPADELAAAMVALAGQVQRLERRLTWRQQLPIQAVLVIVGAVVGYLLGVWNPLR